MPSATSARTPYLGLAPTRRQAAASSISETEHSARQTTVNARDMAGGPDTQPPLGKNSGGADGLAGHDTTNKSPFDGEGSRTGELKLRLNAIDEAFFAVNSLQENRT